MKAAALHSRLQGNVGETIAVIIPSYGHAGLVIEALHSVYNSQPFGLPVEIIVSVDGDPVSELADVLYTEAYGNSSLNVLFAPNGGPGAARNRAIEFALSNFVDLGAVFFLDSDNRLMPNTLRKLWAHMCRTGAAWVYTNIDAFGVPWTAHYGDNYSALRHCITENTCDTGSMVSAEVFRAGIRFDERRENGFEDWEFWLSCIDAGFVGARCHDVALEYRARPEGRFLEAQRDRSSSLGFLRREHKRLFRRDSLVLLEHRDAPRYGLLVSEKHTIELLTDPNVKGVEIGLDDIVNTFWAAHAEPDNFHFPPFIVACGESTLELLQRSTLFPNILSRAEALAEKAGIVVVNFVYDETEIRITEEFDESDARGRKSGVLAMIRSSILEDMADNGAVQSVLERQWPSSAIITVNFRLLAGERTTPFGLGEDLLVNFAALVASSPMRKGGSKRWTWRSKMLTPHNELYLELRRELGGFPVIPLCKPPDGRKTVAILNSIASFGGAEKASYAAARALKSVGFETHMFVLGSNHMTILDEFMPYFDFVHIWESDIRSWDSNALFFGQDILSASANLDWELLLGQLTGFDLVINNHAMAAHAIMGRLRSQGSRTACYLHVIDETRLGRSAGQPYAAVAFEHVYDAYLTCSKQLKVYLRSFGVGDGKIFSVRNGPGFALTPVTTEKVRRRREASSADCLRLLYFGRLDLQKGIDRLLAIFEKLSDLGVQYEARIVGTGVLGDDPTDWIAKLSEYAEVFPPVFATDDVVSHFCWADALVLASRWEGAPLVIPEAQMTGCIPICAAVGAIEEQIIDGVDGLLVPETGERELIDGFVRAILTLKDPGQLKALIAGSLKAAEANDWSDSFAPFLEWANR